MTRCDTNCVPQVSEIHPFKRMLDEFGCFKQKLRAMLHGTRLKWSKSSHITYRLTLVIPLVTSVHTKRWSSTGCVSKSASRSIPPNCSRKVLKFWKGSGIVWVFLRFLLFPVLSFSLLFEGAISTVFVILLSFNLSFSMEFATFWCYLQHFGVGSCNITGICSNFEFEPLIFHGICNILVLIWSSNCSWNMVLCN